MKSVVCLICPCTEGSGLLVCYAMQFGKHFQTFWSTIVPSSSQSSRPRRVSCWAAWICDSTAVRRVWSLAPRKHVGCTHRVSGASCQSGSTQTCGLHAQRVSGASCQSGSMQACGLHAQTVSGASCQSTVCRLHFHSQYLVSLLLSHSATVSFTSIKKTSCVTKFVFMFLCFFAQRGEKLHCECRMDINVAL
jgi:hypothetical protein